MPFYILLGQEKGWKIGVESLEDLRVWSRAYENRYMVPDESNAALAGAKIMIILWKMPCWMHGFGKRVFATVMEESSPRFKEGDAVCTALFCPRPFLSLLIRRQANSSFCLQDHKLFTLLSFCVLHSYNRPQALPPLPFFSPLPPSYPQAHPLTRQ